ncbi:MAG: hypothetical protein AMXMBFR22_26700 [Phycisphaerae bacterium]
MQRDREEASLATFGDDAVGDIEEGGVEGASAQEEADAAGALDDEKTLPVAGVGRDKDRVVEAIRDEATCQGGVTSRGRSPAQHPGERTCAKCP